MIGRTRTTLDIDEDIVRVLASPMADVGMFRPADLVLRLRQFCDTRHHVFWRLPPLSVDTGVALGAVLGATRDTLAVLASSESNE